MTNKINKERRRTTNAAPTRPSNKSQRQGAQEDPQTKQGRAQGRARAGKPPHKNKQSVADKELKENK
jgi:hypothetical protein